MYAGLRKGSTTPAAELKAKARAMRDAGYSYSQIARALGLSKSTAWNWLHEGLTPGGQSRSCRSLPFGKFGARWPDISDSERISWRA